MIAITLVFNGMSKVFHNSKNSTNCEQIDKNIRNRISPNHRSKIPPNPFFTPTLPRKNFSLSLGPTTNLVPLTLN